LERREVKALFYPEFDRIELRDLPVPEPAPDEVLLRVAACGLCGSELETFKTHNPRRAPPLVMGHEFCGTVQTVGKACDQALVGRRFVSNSVVPCGDCTRCRRGDTHLCDKRQIFGMHRPGAFAEFVSVPVGVLIPWPDELPARAACLAEPLANGVHIVNLTRHLQIRRALVIGAGPIGLMCQQALQAMLEGVEVMTCDLSTGRLEVATRLGAAKTVCSRQDDVKAEVLEWTAGEGVDLAIDAAGGAVTKRLSLSTLRPGGTAVWIGLHDNRMELDTYELTLGEKQIFGTYAARKDELREALDLMLRKKVDVISWTEVAPLDRSTEVFHRMLDPGEQDLKAVFSLQEEINPPFTL
jgi:threonine dehydrogenase-like Zn-dependent dehydrogenase